MSNEEMITELQKQLNTYKELYAEEVKRSQRLAELLTHRKIQKQRIIRKKYLTVS